MSGTAYRTNGGESIDFGTVASDKPSGQVIERISCICGAPFWRERPAVVSQGERYCPDCRKLMRMQVISGQGVTH
jgi:hypothetical protein